jgi:hypothetical protein
VSQGRLNINKGSGVERDRAGVRHVCLAFGKHATLSSPVAVRRRISNSKTTTRPSLSNGTPPLLLLIRSVSVSIQQQHGSLLRCAAAADAAAMCSLGGRPLLPRWGILCRYADGLWPSGPGPCCGLSACMCLRRDRDVYERPPNSPSS